MLHGKDKMKLLITGANGFLGGILANFFLKEGHFVRMAVRNKASLKNCQNAEIIEIDFKDLNSLEVACQGVDTIIHTAGLSSKDCEINPVYALEVYGCGTQRLIDSAVRMRVRRIIFLSTIHVYSSQLKGLINEDEPTANLSPYATSHIIGENCILFAHESKLIEGCVVRLSNVFGIPKNENISCWSLLINDLCKQAVQKSILELKSDGQSYRDFISSNKFCEAIYFLSDLKLDFTKRPIYNLGSGKSRKVIEIAEIVKNIFKQQFGMEMSISKKGLSIKEIEEGFVYDCKHFKNHNYNLNDNFTDEVLNLLKYCHSTFTVFK